MTTKMRGAILIGLAVTAVATAVTWAQGAVQVPGPGSLAALTDEMHQLRLAVEDSAKSQTQIQAMTVYVSAQQSRLGQISARLDKAHADTLTASVELQRTSNRWAELQTDMAQNMTPQERAAFADVARATKSQNDAAAERETQMRIRENNLLVAFQAEESRWQELIARLEALVRR